MRLALCVVAAVVIVSVVMGGEKRKNVTPPKAIAGDKAKNDSPAKPDTGKDDNSNNGRRDDDKSRSAKPDSDDKDGKGDKKNDVQDGKKNNKKNSKKDTVVDGRRIPPGIAKQGDAKVDKWLNSKGQLKKDLDDIYDKDPRKRGDKDARQSRADALYDALSDIGMDPEEARRLLRGMASSKDKDDAYDAVRKAIGDASVGGLPGEEVVTHAGSIVDGADSAAAVGNALKKWLRK